jgi:hypothetical protein
MSRKDLTFKIVSREAQSLSKPVQNLFKDHQIALDRKEEKDHINSLEGDPISGSRAEALEKVSFLRQVNH